MQKKIIALAVAGLVSGAAFADGSSVTVYGIADVSFDVVSTSGGAAAGSKTGNYTRVSSNSSYLGFKGSEDLGNGMNAVFQIESGVGLDSSAATLGTSRDSFAGLKGGFGSMTLGVQTLPTRKLGTQIDVNAGATGIGDNKGLINRGWDTRQSNSALYTSPTLGGGFTLSAGYSAGENKSADGASGTAAQQNNDGWDLGATYDNGQALVGLTYGTSKNRDVADNREKNIRLAGAYNFGQGSIRAMWDSNKNDMIGYSQKQNVWGLGGTFNVAGNGKLLAQYYSAKDMSTSVGNVANTGAKLFELGYEHSLSKRTMIKAIYARISNDSAATFNFGTNGVNNVGAGVDPSGLQVGIRHAF